MYSLKVQVYSLVVQVYSQVEQVYSLVVQVYSKVVQLHGLAVQMYGLVVQVSVGSIFNARFTAVNELDMGEGEVADLAVELPFPLAVDRHLGHLHDVANL